MISPVRASDYSQGFGPGMAGILRPSEYPLFPLQARFPAEALYARTRNTRMPAGVLLFYGPGRKFFRRARDGRLR